MVTTGGAWGGCGIKLRFTPARALSGSLNIVDRGVQGLHAPGVQKGGQKCGFVRGSRWARNPVVAPFQFRPATAE